MVVAGARYKFPAALAGSFALKTTFLAAAASAVSEAATLTLHSIRGRGLSLRFIETRLCHETTSPSQPKEKPKESLEADILQL